MIKVGDEILLPSGEKGICVGFSEEYRIMCVELKNSLLPRYYTSNFFSGENLKEISVCPTCLQKLPKRDSASGIM